MGLLPSKITKTWYQPQSFIYQHFIYLWRNPLWQSKLPAGWPECVLFWMALFSLVIFRPLVWLVMWVFRPLTTWFGPLDRALRRFFAQHLNKLFNIPDRKGIGLFFALAALAVLLLVVSLFVLLSRLYWFLVIPHRFVHVTLWVGVTFFVALGSINKYIREHGGLLNKQRCRVERYYWVWSALSLLAYAVFARHDSWLLLQNVGGGFVWAGGVIWWATVWLGCATMQLMRWCWSWLLLFGIGCWHFLTWSPVAHIPWWVFYGAVVYVLYLLGDKFGLAPESKPAPAYTTKEDWCHLFVSVINGPTLNARIGELLECGVDDDCERTAMQTIRYAIFMQMARQVVVLPDSVE